MPELRWLAVDPGPAVYAGVHDLVAGVAALGGAVGWLHVPSRDETSAWLDATLAGPARLLLALEDGVVVGCGLWEWRPEPVMRQNAQIRKVMVAAAARGRGVARLLVGALVADAERAGVEVLTLSARGNNHGALGLYLSLGFTVSGRLPDYIAVGQDRFDEVLLHRDLRIGRGSDPPLVRHGGRREGPGRT